MRQFMIAAGLLLLIMSPFQSQGDTIILKSGRTIDSTKCWDDGELVKCKLHGQIVGYPKSGIEEYRIDNPPEKPATGFRFDMWQSGITISEAIDIAEAHDKPFHKDGLISANKTFNPKMCRPYADTATKFYYKDQIFGRWATLTFDFTQTSKRLYSLVVSFSGPGISRQSEFRDQIEAMLRKKYGNDPIVTDHIVFQTYDWSINKNTTVTMRIGGNSILVIYIDKPISIVAEDEKLKNIRKNFTTNDKEKF